MSRRMATSSTTEDARNLGQTLKILWFFSNEIAGLLRESQAEEVFLEFGWRKVPNWECLLVHRKQGLFLSVYVDCIKMAGKKQNIMAPMWKK